MTVHYLLLVILTMNIYMSSFFLFIRGRKKTITSAFLFEMIYVFMWLGPGWKNLQSTLVSYTQTTVIFYYIACKIFLLGKNICRILGIKIHVLKPYLLLSLISPSRSDNVHLESIWPWEHIFRSFSSHCPNHHKWQKHWSYFFIPQVTS